MRSLFSFLFVTLTIAAYSQPLKTNNVNLLKAAIQAGDKAGYFSVLSRLNAAYPNDAEIVYYNGFYQYYFENNNNLALQSFSRAISLNPKLGLAYIGRAKLLDQKGFYDKAAADISIILKDNPNAPELYTTRGGYHFSDKNYDAALADFLKVQALAPKKPDSYNDAANVYKVQGDLPAAEAMYSKGLAVTGIDSQTLQCYYGGFLVGQGRFKEAIAQYTVAFSGSQDNLYAEDYSKAAIAYYKTADLPAAIKYADLAISRDGGNPDYYLNRASIALDQKDWPTVLAMGQKALPLAPENPRVMMILAIGYKYTGNAALGAEYEQKAKILQNQ